MELGSARSILYVPGDSPRKLSKTSRISADAFIVDWEDAVSESNKQRARDATREAMPALKALGRPVLIRINATRGDLVRHDCEAVQECDPAGIVIPKCEGAGEMNELLAELPGSVPVLPLIETPRGVVNAPVVALASARVTGLMFGAEDYCAAMRILRTAGEPELAFARCSVANAARAAGLSVFDSPQMAYKDLDTVRAAARRSRVLGFTGQAAIHPAQVPVINEVFAPTDAEIDKASKVVLRFKDRRGGVYGVDGVLEDQPIVKQALEVLAMRQ